MRSKANRSLPATRLGAGVVGAVAALGVASAFAATASADPQGQATVLSPNSEGGKGGDQTAAGEAKTPKKPDTPLDNTWLAPPLPGYVLMFVLGGAVVALNLWSSKRTQLD
ncbi:MAG: hypothetical protein FJ253_00015 [Phycisphaerae bacterium]|nr:hypothetical protein [Phycisphaerae bacterium]